MKVICIDATGHSAGFIPIPEGDIVNASQCPVHKDSYDILEYPVDCYGCPVSYKKYRFVPLSTIDETELIRERKTELV